MTIPFAHDLDMVGERSIHRLLDTAVSRGGSARLNNWLLATEPDSVQIERRQALVRELVRLTAFRDRLTLNGWLAAGDSGDSIDGDRVLAWFRGQAQAGPSRVDMLFLSALAVVNALLFIGNSLGVLPRWWPFTFLVYAGYSLFRLRALGDLFGQAMSLRDGMGNLHGIFRSLETYHFGANLNLRGLCAPFLDQQQRPSAQLRRLERVVAATGLRGNPLLWTLVNAVVPWDIGFAWLLDSAAHPTGSANAGLAGCVVRTGSACFTGDIRLAQPGIHAAEL